MTGPGDWSIADRYFYQAGPLPEDRYEALEEANKKAEAVVAGAMKAIAENKCPCKKHRSYQAKRKPSTACETCWRYYVKKNP